LKKSLSPTQKKSESFPQISEKQCRGSRPSRQKEKNRWPVEGLDPWASQKTTIPPTLPPGGNEKREIGRPRLEKKNVLRKRKIYMVITDRTGLSYRRAPGKGKGDHGPSHCPPVSGQRLKKRREKIKSSRKAIEGESNSRSGKKRIKKKVERRGEGASHRPTCSGQTKGKTTRQKRLKLRRNKTGGEKKAVRKGKPKAPTPVCRPAKKSRPRGSPKGVSRKKNVPTTRGPHRPGETKANLQTKKLKGDEINARMACRGVTEKKTQNKKKPSPGSDANLEKTPLEKNRVDKMET